MDVPWTIEWKNQEIETTVTVENYSVGNDSFDHAFGTENLPDYLEEFTVDSVVVHGEEKTSPAGKRFLEHVKNEVHSDEGFSDYLWKLIKEESDECEGERRYEAMMESRYDNY